MVRALDFYLDRPGSNPTIGRKYFQLCFIPLLRVSYCKKVYSILYFNIHKSVVLSIIQ